MQELRDSFSALHIGAKRTGKTTASLAMMVEFWENQRKPCIVLDLSRHQSYDRFKAVTLEDLPRLEQFTGRKYFVYRPFDPMNIKYEVIQFCTMVTQYVRNTAVIFEDFTVYLAGNVHPTIQNMMLGSRNACNDYIFNVHSFSDTGPFALKHCEVYIVRHTVDNPDSLTPNIPYAIRPVVAQAIKEINRENRNIPTGEPRLAFRTVLREEGRILR